jgi:hypothetical protein
MHNGNLASASADGTIKVWGVSTISFLDTSQQQQSQQQPMNQE